MRGMRIVRHRVLCVVAVARMLVCRLEKVRREPVRTQRESEWPLVRRHEAHWNERAERERHQQNAGEPLSGLPMESGG